MMEQEINALLEAFQREGAREAEIITGLLRTLAHNARLRREFLGRMAKIIDENQTPPSGVNSLAAHFDAAGAILPP